MKLHSIWCLLCEQDGLIYIDIVGITDCLGLCRLNNLYDVLFCILVLVNWCTF